MSIPTDIQRIAKKQAAVYYWKNYKFVCRKADIDDFRQEIYKRLWNDNLWECPDRALIKVVAVRACIDYTRKIIQGHRKKKALKEIPYLLEYEKEDSKIYDRKTFALGEQEIFNDSYYEIMSLRNLIKYLEPVKNKIVKELIKGHTLKEIGKKLELTEARICQVRSEIIKRLIFLYKKDTEWEA